MQSSITHLSNNSLNYSKTPQKIPNYKLHYSRAVGPLTKNNHLHCFCHSSNTAISTVKTEVFPPQAKIHLATIQFTRDWSYSSRRGVLSTPPNKPKTPSQITLLTFHHPPPSPPFAKWTIIRNRTLLRGARN